jgi:regulatory factor X
MPVGLPQHQQIHHVRQASEQFEDSPAPEDSENQDNPNVKRRPKSGSSLANDEELKRLLAQHETKTLKDVAADVQRNEGAGGKSEKAKQVFAMLWLRDTCHRSHKSVRRDAVFSSYTRTCGNERVPTLNPASFGKLVRIIFPDVQTRRLGVRGESKYHYVDLSLVDEDGDGYSTQPPPLFSGGDSRFEHTRPTSSSGPRNIPAGAQERPASSHKQQPPMDTADFPAPSTTFLPRASVEPTPPQTFVAAPSPITDRMDCHYLNTPIIRIQTARMSPDLIAALPSVRSSIPATLSSYLAMPKQDSLRGASPSSQESFVIPDIHRYLTGISYDAVNAESLSHLYRSYCIDVIDAFRKVKERPFFAHHSAYNGKMTVPLSKIFHLQAVAPWIQECDMLMYKKMVGFIAQLPLQEVPEGVWQVLGRISEGLVGHLVTAFEEKCPAHVVVAKVLPAARFANLLKKLRSANASALYVSGMLSDEDKRTEMWLELQKIVDPTTIVDESMPPAQSLGAIEGIIRHDIKNLLCPLNEDMAEALTSPDSAFSHFCQIQDYSHTGLMTSTMNDDTSPLERWVKWLELLPQVFAGHHPQCMIDWHNRLWKGVIQQLGVSGANTYQAWWYLEGFLSNMLSYLCLKEGLLMSNSEQEQLDANELAKKRQDEPLIDTTLIGGVKRKRGDTDVGGEDRTSRPSTADSFSNLNTCPPMRQYSTLPPSRQSSTNTLQQHDGGDEQEPPSDPDLHELTRGGPLDLPPYKMISSPVKGYSLMKGLSPVKRLPLTLHDDSGIAMMDEGRKASLGDDLDEMGRNLRRDWMLNSDAVDVEGEIRVV